MPFPYIERIVGKKYTFRNELDEQFVCRVGYFFMENVRASHVLVAFMSF